MRVDMGCVGSARGYLLMQGILGSPNVIECDRLQGTAEYRLAVGKICETETELESEMHLRERVRYAASSLAESNLAIRLK